MSNYRSTRYAKLRQTKRREGIAAYYRHKAAAELIPENENVFVPPKPLPDVVVTIKCKGHPRMQFSSFRLPNGWTISPTLAGQKIQQVMLGYLATADSSPAK